MNHVTQAEFARIQGVNKSTVTRWLQNGRMQVTAQGLIDVEAAKRMLAATESPAAHHQARKAQFDEAKAATNAFSGPDQGYPCPNTQNGNQSPANNPATHGATAGATASAAENIGTALKLETYKLQKAKAETANVELDKMAGALCERSEVDYALNDFGNTLRALLEAMPDRLASQLSTLHGDVAAMHKAIEEAMHDALASMAENMKRKTERLNP
jgi:phage terminase Nu1 subunit (DNA packaging protein)